MTNTAQFKLCDDASQRWKDIPVTFEREFVGENKGVLYCEAALVAAKLAALAGVEVRWKWLNDIAGFYSVDP